MPSRITLVVAWLAAATRVGALILPFTEGVVGAGLIAKQITAAAAPQTIGALGSASAFLLAVKETLGNGRAGDDADDDGAAPVEVRRIMELSSRQREAAKIYKLAGEGACDAALTRLEALLRAPRAGRVADEPPALATCNAVLWSLARAGRCDDAQRLISELPFTSTSSHNALIHAYARARRREDALRVLYGLVRRNEADIRSFGCAMNACAREGDAATCERMHARLLARADGSDATNLAPSRAKPNEFTYGALVHANAEAAQRARQRQRADEAARFAARAVEWFEEGQQAARSAAVAGEAWCETDAYTDEPRFARMMLRQHDGKVDGALSAAGASAPRARAPRARAPAAEAGDLLEAFRAADEAESFRTAEEAESAELANSLLALLSSSAGLSSKPAPLASKNLRASKAPKRAPLDDDTRAPLASPRTPRKTALAAHASRADLQPKISAGKSVVLRSNRPSRRYLKPRRALEERSVSSS